MTRLPEDWPVDDARSVYAQRFVDRAIERPAPYPLHLLAARATADCAAENDGSPWPAFEQAMVTLWESLTRATPWLVSEREAS